MEVIFKGKIGIMKKSSQKFISFLYIVIDNNYFSPNAIFD
jgi:hypothetical protein